MTNLSLKVTKLHGNKGLPAGIRRSEVENLDISDRKWRERSIGDRFAAALAVVGVDRAAKETGKSPRQLNRYAKGDEIGVSILVKVAELAGVTVEWLVSGAPLLDLMAAVPDSFRQGSERRVVLLPRYDVRASAGAGALVVSDDVDEYFHVGRDWLRRSLPSWAAPNAEVGILEGSGDSMEPTIFDGDLLMVVRGVKWHIVERGGIFVFTLDDRLLLKRLQVLDNGDLLIISDNKAYDPMKVRFDDIQHRLILHGLVFFAGGRPRAAR